MSEFLHYFLKSFFNLYHSLAKFSRHTTTCEYFSYSFPENMIWHFMQNVSSGDNLHEMLYSVFWGKIRKTISKCRLLKFYQACCENTPCFDTFFENSRRALTGKIAIKIYFSYF